MATHTSGHMSQIKLMLHLCDLLKFLFNFSSYIAVNTLNDAYYYEDAMKQLHTKLAKSSYWLLDIKFCLPEVHFCNYIKPVPRGFEGVRTNPLF